MLSNRVLALAVVLCCMGPLRPTAKADAPIKFESPAQCTTEGGSSVTLPPGFFLDVPTWEQLDAEVKRLQDQETRLKAANKSLKESLGKGGATFTIIATSFALGFGLALAI